MFEFTVTFRTGDTVKVGREIDPGEEYMTLLRPCTTVEIYYPKPSDWVARDNKGDERYIFWFGNMSGWIMYEQNPDLEPETAQELAQKETQTQV